MNLEGVKESKNFEDKTTAPWYDANKLLAHVIMNMHRLIGDKKQKELDAKRAQMDANPIRPMTPQEKQANYNAKVVRAPHGTGWYTETPDSGGIQTYVPDYVDVKTIQQVLKQAGLAK